MDTNKIDRCLALYITIIMPMFFINTNMINYNCIIIIITIYILLSLLHIYVLSV